MNEFTFGPFGNSLGIGPFLFFGSPGSDVFPSNQENTIYWGRDGNDTFLSFDPSADNLLQFDILIGDLVEVEQILLPEEGRILRNWQDRFVLGDWQQPYYVSDIPLIFGLNQFALIADFNPSQDIIQLHGTPKDYQLVTSPLGTGIFWQQGTTLDLIAFLPLVSDLSLERNSFEFVGNTPPEGPVLENIQQLGTAGPDGFTGLATDPLSNLYVAGASRGNAWALKYDSDGNQLWSQEFGSSRSDSSTRLATDNHGNSYLVGVTLGDLGGSNAGSLDVWLAKLDSEGNQVWLEQFGTQLVDISYSIDVDGDGNIYLSGHSGKPVSDDEQSLLGQTLDSWVTKYDNDGNQLWFREFGASSLNEAYGVAVGNDNSVYATGWTVGNFGGENAGLYDVWLAKLDSEGNPVWTEQFGTEDYEFPWGMDIDSKDNLYITGWTLGDLGGENAGSYDVWVAKYDSNGNQLWIKQLGTKEDDGTGTFLGGIKVDSNDDIFLTGYTDGKLGGENAGSYDAWAAKYDSDGKQLWIEQFGTPNFDYAGNVTTDISGNLYVTGWTEGSLGDMNAGSADAWVAKFDAESGTLQKFTGDVMETIEILALADNSF
ncbi:MAG: SBBP repeat-containing protein [Xenococcus sp. MO_188.B8]|nr:SBBP repeat-containing protein [Xenococcus sp. MO_188.B8]